MLLALLFAVSVLSGLAGIVAGWALTRWTLRTTECPRCGERAGLEEIAYRCECGETVTVEEL